MQAIVSKHRWYGIASALRMRAAVAIARVDSRFCVIVSTVSFATFKLSHLQKHIKGLWLINLSLVLFNNYSLSPNGL